MVSRITALSIYFSIGKEVTGSCLGLATILVKKRQNLERFYFHSLGFSLSETLELRCFFLRTTNKQIESLARYEVENLCYSYSKEKIESINESPACFSYCFVSFFSFQFTYNLELLDSSTPSYLYSNFSMFLSLHMVSMQLKT